MKIYDWPRNYQVWTNIGFDQFRVLIKHIFRLLFFRSGAATNTLVVGGISEIEETSIAYGSSDSIAERLYGEYIVLDKSGVFID